MKIFFMLLAGTSTPAIPSIYNFNHNGGASPAYFKTSTTRIKRLLATGILKCS